EARGAGPRRRPGLRALPPARRLHILTLVGPVAPGEAAVMKLCKITYPGGPVVGLVEGDRVKMLAHKADGRLPALSDIPYADPPTAARAAVEAAYTRSMVSAVSVPLNAFPLLPPIDNQEVWAAGVTYKRSQEAREDESHKSGIYDRVYAAERPELF